MFTFAHLHLLLNHVPIIVTALGLCLLAAALLRRGDDLARLALVFFVGGALATIPTYFTGEPAADAIDGLPGVTKAIIDRHEDAAGIAAIAVGALGVFALFALWRYRTTPHLPRAVTRVTMAGALAGSGLIAWTGFLGGQVRHTEVRSQPVTAGAATPAAGAPAP